MAAYRAASSSVTACVRLSGIFFLGAALPGREGETVFVCVNTVHLLQSGVSLFGEIHK